MADHQGSDFDWSAKHTRLRAEMVILSVVIFSITQLGLEPSKSSLLPIDPTTIPREYVVCGFSIWWAVTSAHFVIRTRVEYNAVFAALYRLKMIDKDIHEGLLSTINELRRANPRTSLQEILNEAPAIWRSLDEEITKLLQPTALANAFYDIRGWESTAALRELRQRVTHHGDSIWMEANRNIVSIRSNFIKEIEETNEKYVSTIQDVSKLMSSQIFELNHRMIEMRQLINGAEQSHRWDRLFFGIIFPIATSAALGLICVPEILDSFSIVPRFLAEKWGTIYDLLPDSWTIYGPS